MTSPHPKGPLVLSPLEIKGTNDPFETKAYIRTTLRLQGDWKGHEDGIMKLRIAETEIEEAKRTQAIPNDTVVKYNTNDSVIISMPFSDFATAIKNKITAQENLLKITGAILEPSPRPDIK